MKMLDTKLRQDGEGLVSKVANLQRERQSLHKRQNDALQGLGIPAIPPPTPLRVAGDTKARETGVLSVHPFCVALQTVPSTGKVDTTGLDVVFTNDKGRTTVVLYWLALSDLEGILKEEAAAPLKEGRASDSWGSEEADKVLGKPSLWRDRAGLSGATNYQHVAPSTSTGWPSYRRLASLWLSTEEGKKWLASYNNPFQAKT
jgi:hypothetical protein